MPHCNDEKFKLGHYRLGTILVCSPMLQLIVRSPLSTVPNISSRCINGNS